MKRFGVVITGVIGLVGLSLVSMSGGASARSLSPTVVSVVPDHGPVAGGTIVTISGSNLLGATGVTFGSTPASTIINRTESRLQVISPPGTAGPAVNIQVTTSEGTSAQSSLDLFSYVTTPAIQSVRPDVGSSLGHNLVAISGSDFVGVTAVDFGSTPALSFTVLSPNAIAAVSPGGAVGSVDVTVTATDGTTPIDPADQYTYVLRVPIVTSVVFDVGSPAGGETVNIYGSKFERGATVNFGTTPATNVVYKGTGWLQATAPPGTGEVDVNVVTSKGASQIDPQDVYLYSATAP